MQSSRTVDRDRFEGYGQSDIELGNYVHGGVSEQLWTMLQQIGLTEFNVVTHDHGSAQGDFIAASHLASMLQCGCGEQHLYHFDPVLAPQAGQIRDAAHSGVMTDPKRYVISHFIRVAEFPITDMERVIREFWYPGVTHARPQRFASSTFRQEWLARRNHLLAAQICPVMIMQGYGSKSQPHEL